MIRINVAVIITVSLLWTATGTHAGGGSNGGLRILSRPNLKETHSTVHDQQEQTERGLYVSRALYHTRSSDPYSTQSYWYHAHQSHYYTRSSKHSKSSKQSKSKGKEYIYESYSKSTKQSKSKGKGKGYYYESNSKSKGSEGKGKGFYYESNGKGKGSEGKGKGFYDPCIPAVISFQGKGEGYGNSSKSKGKGKGKGVGKGKGKGTHPPIPCPTIPPTIPPTPVPTKPPTIPPTPVPTKPPTIPPTKNKSRLKHHKAPSSPTGYWLHSRNESPTPTSDTIDMLASPSSDKPPNSDVIINPSESQSETESAAAGLESGALMKGGGSNEESSKISVGAIVAPVVGGVVLLVAFVFVLYNRRACSSEKQESDSVTFTNEHNLVEIDLGPPIPEDDNDYSVSSSGSISCAGYGFKGPQVFKENDDTRSRSS